MDNKRMWINMSLVIGLIMLWLYVILPYLKNKYHWTDEVPNPQTNTQTASTTTAPTTGVATTGASTTNPATSGPSTAIVRGGPVTTQPIVLGSAEYEHDPDQPKSPFPLGLTLSQHGASIESVALNRFRLTADKNSGSYVFQEPYQGVSEQFRSMARALATRTVTIDGGTPINLDNVSWQLESVSNKSANFIAEIPGQLRITKTYEIRDKSDRTAGYEVLITHKLENLADHELKVRLAFNGTNTPKPENTRDIPEIVAGFDAGRQAVDLGHNPTSSIKDADTFDIKSLNKTYPMLWNGMVSAYFDAIVRPTDAAGAPMNLSSAKANVLTPGVTDPQLRGVAIALDTPDLTVPAGASTSFALNTFFGPKLRDVLRSSYYENYPLAYDQTLILRATGGFGRVCGICTWDWLIEILVKLLRGLHVIVRDWGLAIIGLVAIVRLLLHPVTKASQVSMSRMTKMGPELERLKKKYGEDEEGFKKAQVEFYREQGVAPFLGCLPMFLQMPIWIALWSSLQSTFEIRHAQFLWGYTWIHDLSQADRLITFSHPISLLFFHIDAINLLPIIMGIVFYVNQKFQPQPVAANDQQKQQQAMMKWMSVFMFPIFLYTSPSGLNLYIFTSTLVGIFESKRIRDHIKEKEDREKAGVVLVDGDAKDLPPQGAPRRVKKSATSGAIAGFMAKLQQMAEEAKKEQDRKGKGKK